MGEKVGEDLDVDVYFFFSFCLLFLFSPLFSVSVPPSLSQINVCLAIFMTYTLRKFLTVTL